MVRVRRWRRRGGVMGGARSWPLHVVRKRFGLLCFAALALTLFTFMLLSVNITRESRAQQLELRLAEVQLRLQYIDSMYRSRQEDVLQLESGAGSSPSGGVNSSHEAQAQPVTTLSPEFIAHLKNLSGSAAAAGFDPRSLAPLKMPPLAYHLLPHLLSDEHSTRPLFHMHGARAGVDVVIGVPSVRRDKESYLVITLTQLVGGLSAEDERSTLIVILLGETDPDFILQTARQIESLFPKQVESGLIEVLSPRASFYPDLESMQPTLGDPAKRFKWRTKQNLDNIFLMTYCRQRGTLYLMLEDDIIAKKNYLAEIKTFAAQTTAHNPQWLVIEFCRVGGIGKLFRSSDLLSFITYVQIFHVNLPIDWLIESYLADKVCTIEKSSKQCVQSKLEVRPRYEHSLFQHIGLYSSLSGKIQKLKDTNFGSVPQFTSHNNPPLSSLRTTIEAYSDRTLQKAYEGKSYFWGLKPKKGDFMEFTFRAPMHIGRYRFASGSVEHVSDRLYGARVEVLPESARGNTSAYVVVGRCDELGCCEGGVPAALGKLAAVRLTMHENSDFWLIVREIWISEEKAR